jgi:hypothetical protein
MKPRPQQVTYSKAKGWKVGQSYFKSFSTATQQFPDIRVRSNGIKSVKAEKLGKEFVYEKLGGWRGGLQDIVMGNLQSKIRRQERSYLQMLERRKEAEERRKSQKRLTRFGFAPPVKKKYFTPYAFKY